MIQKLSVKKINLIFLNFAHSKILFDSFGMDEMSKFKKKWGYF